MRHYKRKSEMPTNANFLELKKWQKWRLLQLFR